MVAKSNHTDSFSFIGTDQKYYLPKNSVHEHCWDWGKRPPSPKTFWHVVGLNNTNDVPVGVHTGSPSHCFETDKSLLISIDHNASPTMSSQISAGKTLYAKISAFLDCFHSNIKDWWTNWTNVTFFFSDISLFAGFFCHWYKDGQHITTSYHCTKMKTKCPGYERCHVTLMMASWSQSLRSSERVPTHTSPCQSSNVSFSTMTEIKKRHHIEFLFWSKSYLK